jgi:zinc transport system ATP-binding protein
MSDALVEACGVTVNLGGRAILRGVSCGFERGRVTAVIGLNGSGKTTLLRTVLGEIPYRGEVRFHAKNGPPRVGYVPQKLLVDARLPLTVRDLLALAIQKWPLFLGVSRAARDRMKAMLDRMALPLRLLDQLVERLSGGELQRVLLGLALEPTPDLLLLDEPAAGVDPENERKIYALIESLSRDAGVTVVMVSHDLHLVSDHVDRVVCLRDGELYCEGHPREVLTPEALAGAFGAEKGLLIHRH